MVLRKGFMRIIEVSIVSFISITILLILSTYKPTADDTQSTAGMVYGYFDYLEQSGDLETIAVSKNTTALYNMFGKLIDPRYNFAVGWNNFTASDYSSSPPINKTVHSFSYIVSGHDEHFKPTVFEVFIW